MTASELPVQAEAPDIRTLVRELSGQDKKKRERAESALKELAAGGIEPLLAVLAEGKRWQKERRRRCFWTLGGVLGLYLLLIALLIALHVKIAPFLINAFTWVINPTFIVLAGSAFLPGRVARLLAEQDDPRAVPPLLDALGAGDAEAKRVAAQALVRLLPRLTPANAALLNAEQRARLGKVLGSGVELERDGDPELVLASLKAVEQVGDTKALPPVERLARTAAQPSIRAAAAACLPGLRERLEQEQAVKGLLCPAGASEGRPEALVQPAAAELPGPGDSGARAVSPPAVDGAV